MYKKIYIFFAWICVGAAFIGIFLPLVPTTPFLLLAIFLYMRSSKSGIKMILRNRCLAPYVRSYFAKEGIDAPILLRTILLLWTSIGLCIAFATDNSLIRLLLLGIAIGVTIHLYCRRKGRIRKTDSRHW